MFHVSFNFEKLFIKLIWYHLICFSLSCLNTAPGFWRMPYFFILWHFSHEFPLAFSNGAFEREAHLQKACLFKWPLLNLDLNITSHFLSLCCLTVKTVFYFYHSTILIHSQDNSLSQQLVVKQDVDKIKYALKHKFCWGELWLHFLFRSGFPVKEWCGYTVVSTENFPLRVTKVIKEQGHLTDDDIVRQQGLFSPRKKGSVGII